MSIAENIAHVRAEMEQAAREAAEEAKAAGLDLIDLDELPQL